MPAPTLTPEETREVTRFGMFDTEVFNEIADHWDDVVQCDECDTRAVVLVTRKCCHTVFPLCAAHHEGLISDLEYYLAHRGPICLNCKATFGAPQTVADIITVVTL